MQQFKYRFYAILLDAYNWYLNSEAENAFQEFIDKINRVPYEKSEAALKGIAFNKLLDDIEIENVVLAKPNILYDGFVFNYPLVNAFKAYFKDAASQVYTSAQLETNNGLVELYGFADKVLRYKSFDIKTTSKYEFPKFIFNVQHKVYPYCFNQNGIFVDTFEYTVTDFNHIYKEEYFYRPEFDVPELRSVCESLIDFIERYRHLITDRKIFGLEPVKEPILKIS